MGYKKKVEILRADDCYFLERDINNFLGEGDLKLIDIKYSSIAIPHQHVVASKEYTAMIIYEERSTEDGL